MPRSRPPFRLLMKISSLVVIMLLITSSMPWTGSSPAQAQIDTNSPSQAFTSDVNCIRSGADRGMNSYQSPTFAMSCFSSAWDITSYEQAGNPAVGDAPYTDAAVYEFGDGKPDATGEPGHSSIASVGNNGSNGGGIGLGAVYGLAYATGNNTSSPTAGTPLMYASAYAKRITRFGSGGPGAIYVLNRVTNNETLYVQIPGVVPGPSGVVGNPGDGSQATFPNGTNAASYTPQMGGLHTVQHDDLLKIWAGKAGIGDITLDPQERYLYGVNLWNKGIFRIDTWSANPQASYTLLPFAPAVSDPTSCGADGPDRLRPFAINVTADSVYLGITCSAEATQNRANLAAGVLRYRFATNSWDAALANVFILTNYDAQRLWPSSGSTASQWQPWTSSDTGVASPIGATFRVWPQPLLSSITFDENNNMIIGMRDRMGDIALTPLTSSGQYPMAQGDILLAPFNGSTWDAPTSIAETYNDNSTYDKMPEEAQGALTYIPGTHAGGYGGEVISTVSDPYGANSGGTAWFDASGGNRTASEELYSNFVTQTRFAKAAGLGDVQLLCDWRAIGDRVWRDTNGNGVQDAGENDINGVLLNLINSSGTTVAQVTTGPVSGMSGNFRFYVNPFQTYTMQIDPSNYLSGHPLFGLGVTVQNAGGNDTTDSDASSSSVISVASAGNSDVNTTFDFGLSTGANVTISKSGPATAALGSSFSYTLSYTNQGPSSAATVQIVDTLPAGISYSSASPAPSSVSGQVITWNLGTLASGTSGTITLNVTVLSSAPASVTNSVTISTSTSGDSTSDNNDTVTTTIIRPNVTVSKTGPATAALGTNLSYTLTARNTGTSSAAGVQIVDTLPTGLTYLSAVPAPASVAGQTLTWNAGTMAAGATQTYTVNAGANTTSVANTVVNNATISTTSVGDNPSDNSGNATTTIQRPNVTITKTGPATVTAGQPLAYTLTYQNTGTSSAATVQVRDDLPAGLTYVSASPAPASVSGQTIIWNLGTLAAGASGSITLNATSSAGLANGASVVNTVQIGTSSFGDDTNDNFDTATTVIQRADVYVTKSSPTSFPVVSGQSVSYTIDYGNNGPASASGVTLSDPMPIQLSGVTWSCSAGCAGSGSGNISLSLGTLAAGATGRITVTGTATTNLPSASFINTATISTTTPETNTANNSSSVTGSVWTTDMQVIKLASAQVTAGTTFTATLQYQNNGPAPASTVSLIDTLPAGVSFVSAVPAPTSQSGQTLTWSIGSVASGAGGTIQLTLHSASTLANNTTLVNTAQVSTSTTDRTSSNDTAQASTLVVTQADVRMTKSGPTSVNVGDPVSYSLNYANTGPSVARNVVITDTIPPQLSFVSASPAPSSMSGGVLTWNVGDLAGGATGTIAIQMQTASTQAVNTLPVTNRSVITSSTSDPDPSNNTSQVTTNVLRPDVVIGKSGPGIATDGQTILYTLVYDNRGAAAAANVQVQDTLPAGLSYVSASPAPASVSGQTLTWSLGTLNAGGSGTITVLATVTTAAAPTVVNTAQISTTSPGDDLSNNTASATTTIQRSDVAVSKTGPPTVIMGNSISYTLTYSATGTTLAANTILTDTIPVGLSFVSASVAPSQMSGQNLIWNLGSLSPGIRTSISVLCRVDATAAATITNTARISTSTNGDDPSNNTSQVTTAVLKPNVTITKTAPASVAAGDTFTYTLAYTNTGTAPALGVLITDPLPAGVTYVSASPAPTTITGATLEWNLGTVPAGASGMITIQVIADPAPPPGGGASASVTNTGQITTTSPGDNPGDNTDSRTSIVYWPDLQITKSDGMTQVQPGDVLTYTLTITNTGLAPAHQVWMTETLPLSSSLINGSAWQATSTRGVYHQAIGTLAAGSAITRTIQVQVPNPLPVASITNRVMVAGDVPDPTPADNQSSDTDQTLCGLVGDTAWVDTNGNGVQDLGEAGLPFVPLQLLDATGTQVLATTTTDGQGIYHFRCVRLGTYGVRVDPVALGQAPLKDYTPTTAVTFVAVLTPSQTTDVQVDFGLKPPAQTAITLAYLLAIPQGGTVQVRWGTLSERNTAFFRVIRTTDAAGTQGMTQIGTLAGKGNLGGDYTLVDSAPLDTTAWYWLEEVEITGTTTRSGPVRVDTHLTGLPYTVALPLVTQ